MCDAGVWREATTAEEQEGMACTVAMNRTFNQDSTRICENNKFRETHVYDFDVGVKNYFNPEVEYGTLKDERDGRTYKTVTINGITVMAENLNYADEGAHSYLVGNNWCYNNDTTNCLKGGRYYTWTAAMDIDSKWTKASVPAGTIKTPHQGICPDDWHIPTVSEWNSLFSNIEPTAQQAIGNVSWKNATNASGFSALPIGKYGASNFNLYAIFWSASEVDRDKVNYWIVEQNRALISGDHSGDTKHEGFSVRCIKDSD